MVPTLEVGLPAGITGRKLDLRARRPGVW